jgi:hypothetical protein
LRVCRPLSKSARQAGLPNRNSGRANASQHPHPRRGGACGGAASGGQQQPAAGTGAAGHQATSGTTVCLHLPGLAGFSRVRTQRPFFSGRAVWRARLHAARPAVRPGGRGAGAHPAGEGTEHRIWRWPTCMACSEQLDMGMAQQWLVADSARPGARYLHKLAPVWVVQQSGNGNSTPCWASAKP